MQHSSYSKEVWTQLISAKREFDSTDHPQVAFYTWMKDTYGIELQLEPNGVMSLSNNIVDPGKYLIFMLKHSRI